MIGELKRNTTINAFDIDQIMALPGGKRNIKKVKSHLESSKSALKEGKDSLIPIKKVEVPVHLKTEEVPRPEDEGIDKMELEYTIEKKRIRLINDAIHKAERAKAKKENNMFGVTGVTR